MVVAMLVAMVVVTKVGEGCWEDVGGGKYEDVVY
jgi:hypothetical protein